MPKGTPKEIVDRLHDGLIAALAASDVQAALRDQGAVPAGSTPEQFRQFVREEVAKSDKIVSGSRHTGGMTMAPDAALPIMSA